MPSFFILYSPFKLKDLLYKALKCPHCSENKTKYD